MDKLALLSICQIKINTNTELVMFEYGTKKSKFSIASSFGFISTQSERSEQEGFLSFAVVQSGHCCVRKSLLLLALLLGGSSERRHILEVIRMSSFGIPPLPLLEGLLPKT